VLHETAFINQNYKLCPLNETNANEVIKLTTDRFWNIPILSAVDLTREELYPFVKYYVELAVKQNLSMVAQHIPTNKIATVVIAVDYNEEGVSPPLNQKTEKIIEIIEKMSQKFVANNPNIPRGKIVHPFMGCTAEEHQNGGLLRATITKILEQAKERGYTMAVAECVSPASTKVCYKLGFSLYDTIDMSNEVSTFKIMKDPVVFYLVKDL
jgi:predicted acetyltransferase